MNLLRRLLGLVEVSSDPQPEHVESSQVEPVLETAQEVALEPEPVSEGASDLDRFRAFQQWLERGGPRFEVWAHDSALNGRKGAVLSVVFPSEKEAKCQ